MALVRALRLCANAIGGALFLALFLVFVAQITARFGFAHPLPWTDEAAVILYIWTILWACAFVVPTQEHVAFDLVWNSAPPVVRRVMQAMGNVLVGGLALWALPASWDYVHFMVREETPVLGIPMMAVYFPLVLLLIALVVRSLHGLWQACAGNAFEENSAIQPVEPVA